MLHRGVAACRDRDCGQAEDVAVLFDEATVEKLFDQASVKLGSSGKIETVEPLDHLAGDLEVGRIAHVDVGELVVADGERL